MPVRQMQILVFLAVALSPVLTSAQTAPDATAPGPFATTNAEYKLPAAIDPDVTTELATELWARVYRPTNLSSAPFPLVLFLHGNHATCGRFEGIGPGRFDINVQYTFTGTCPPATLSCQATPDMRIWQSDSPHGATSWCDQCKSRSQRRCRNHRRPGTEPASRPSRVETSGAPEPVEQHRGDHAGQPRFRSCREA